MPDATRSAFRIRLAVVGGVALALRATYTLTTQGNDPPAGDAIYFYGQGRALADGQGFIDPIIYQVFHLKLQAAHHPPLYPVFIALASKVVGTSPQSLRLASCVLGAAAVVVIGLVGRRVGGERTGLLAAAAAAVYPNMWANDALLLSEPLYALMIALVLLAAYRLWDNPRPREAVFLGVALGLATLARAEALLLFVIMAVPLVAFCRSLDRRQRVALAAVVLAAGSFVMAPWVIHNLYRFNRPVTLSYGLSGVLTQANCDKTYSGEYLGYWHPSCSFLDETVGPSAQECLRETTRCAEVYSSRFGDESDVAALGQKEGIQYISDHRGRLPVVVAARVGRMWGVFRPGQQVQIDAVGEGRGLWLARAGLITFYEFVAIAAVGLILLRRRRVPILPLVSMAVLVTVVAALAIPITRYRMPVEVAMAILAGVVADEVITRFTKRKRPVSAAAAAPTHEPARA